MRPESISGPESDSESALLHVLHYLNELEGYEPDLVVFLQATSPMRDSSDIDNAIELLISENADSLFSASRVPGTGHVWRWREGIAKPINHDPMHRLRTQEISDEYYMENGSIYVFCPEILKKTKCRLGGRISIYRQPLEFAFEIDDPKDLALMRKLITLFRK